MKLKMIPYRVAQDKRMLLVVQIIEHMEEIMKDTFRGKVKTLGL